MGKYLHLYDSLENFRKDYDNETEGPVTAITVNGGMAYTQCNDWATRTATSEYNGTYIFDRLIPQATIHGCDNFSETHPVMVFKKGNDEAYLINWDDDSPWGSEEWIIDDEPVLSLIHDLSNAFAVGDVDLTISSVETGEPPYREPWVSYTVAPGKCVSKFTVEFGEDHLNYSCEYAGECKYTIWQQSPLQLHNGFLWKVVNREDVYVISNTMCIDETTPLYGVGYTPELGATTYIVWPGSATVRNFTVVEENLEVDRVDYNKQPFTGSVTVDVFIINGTRIEDKTTVGTVLTFTPEEIQNILRDFSCTALTFRPYYIGDWEDLLGKEMKITPAAADGNSDNPGAGVDGTEPVVIDFGRTWGELHKQNQSLPDIDKIGVILHDNDI